MKKLHWTQTEEGKKKQSERMRKKWISRKNDSPVTIPKTEKEQLALTVLSVIRNDSHIMSLVMQKMEEELERVKSAVGKGQDIVRGIEEATEELRLEDTH